MHQNKQSTLGMLLNMMLETQYEMTIYLKAKHDLKLSDNYFKIFFRLN